MKDEKTLISVGILIYVVTSVIDRFFVNIPDPVYIPVALVGIALIIFGLVKGRKKIKK